ARQSRSLALSGGRYYGAPVAFLVDFGFLAAGPHKEGVWSVGWIAMRCFLHFVKSLSWHIVFVVLGICPTIVYTVKVCVIFLDTLTPMFELYDWLRERRQWGSDSLLTLLDGCGAAVGPFVPDCETESGCGLRVVTHQLRFMLHCCVSCQWHSGTSGSIVRVRYQSSLEKGVAAAEREKGSLCPEREQSSAVWKEIMKKKRREEKRREDKVSASRKGAEQCHQIEGLKSNKGRRRSGNLDATKAEYRGLKKISNKFLRASSIQASASILHQGTSKFGVVVLWFGALVLWSRCARVLGLESSYSGCVLSCRAQGCSGVVVLQCVLYSRTQEFKWVYKVRTQEGKGPMANLISKLMSLVAIQHLKTRQWLSKARIIGNHRQELGVKSLDAEISSRRPAILPSNSLNGQTLSSSSSIQNSKLFCLKQEHGIMSLDVEISSRRPTILPSNSLNGQTLPSSSSVQNIKLFCPKTLAAEELGRFEVELD
ncbi:hypothetical protein Taro_005693, partial [Colocasia esculenta]|nr:hypothetical protein [Colocasia esculenta]